MCDLKNPGAPCRFVNPVQPGVVQADPQTGVIPLTFDKPVFVPLDPCVGSTFVGPGQAFWLTPHGIRFKKLDPSAVVPAFKTPGSAGLDLTVIEDKLIGPRQTVTIRTGLAWGAPDYMVGIIRPRSSIFLKGLDINGTIDSDYRGEILLMVRNTTENPVGVEKGTRLAQLIPVQLFWKGVPAVREVTDLDETARGAGGFGSTGR